MFKYRNLTKLSISVFLRIRRIGESIPNRMSTILPQSVAKFIPTDFLHEDRLGAES